MLLEYHYQTGQATFNSNKNVIDKTPTSVVDTTTMKKKVSNFNGIHKNVNNRLMTNSYWCRDQNFRKYFEMRKKNGIEPSTDVNTYYNKDKAAPYWNSHIQMDDMLSRVSEIK